jgi:hypothetical protein
VFDHSDLDVMQLTGVQVSIEQADFNWISFVFFNVDEAISGDPVFSGQSVSHLLSRQTVERVRA